MTAEQISELDVEAIKARFDAFDAGLNRRDLHIEVLEQDLDKLRAEHAWMKRQLFGQKAERFADPNQHTLGFSTDGQAEAAPEPAEADDEGPKKRRRGKRRPLPEDLPHVVKVHDLPDDQKTDPATGEPLRLIGFEESKQLGFEPGRIFVLHHKVAVYARPGENLDGEHPEVVTAERTAEGLPKCLAAPSLLAEIAVRKYGDHLPLDRLVKVFKRSGVELSKASMCRWMQGVGELIEPLVELMKRRMLAHSHVIQSDETPVRQQAPGTGKTRECWFWPRLGQPGTAGRYVVFDYTQTRGGEHARDWFTRERDDGSHEKLFLGGLLQGDGFTGVNALFDPGGGWEMTRVGCWAHARRYFHNARGSSPGLAAEGLARIQQLYRIEKDVADAPAAEKLAARREHAAPLVDGFFAWAAEQQAFALPKSVIGKAFTYALNQEASLRVYLDDGQVEIDNNACERSLRGIGIGRKNWLFTGSPAGGLAAARIFSVLGSAGLHGVEPVAYLRDLITRLPTTSPEQLERFLPDVWQAERAAAADGASTPRG